VYKRQIGITTHPGECADSCAMELLASKQRAAAQSQNTHDPLGDENVSDLDICPPPVVFSRTHSGYKLAGIVGRQGPVWVGNSCPTLLTLILALLSKGIGAPRPCHVNPTSKASDKSVRPHRHIRYTEGRNGATSTSPAPKLSSLSPQTAPSPPSAEFAIPPPRRSESSPATARLSADRTETRPSTPRSRRRYPVPAAPRA